MSITSDLVTIGVAAFPYAAPVFTNIDLGAVLMGATAAFGMGGAVLGTIDFQIARFFE